MNAILYLATGGCQWRMLPKDFPPLSTVQGYFYDWRNRGLFQAINHLLVMSARELEGREASPTAGVIDSQSVKTTESGGVRGGAGKSAPRRRVSPMEEGVPSRELSIDRERDEQPTFSFVIETVR
jgi:hypothetical protein